MSLPLVSDLFASFARSAAPIVVAGLWQGLAVSAGLALCLKAAPRISAAQRFILWASAFVTLAALPLAGIALHSLGASTPDFSAASPHPWLQLDARWTFVLASLWLLASAARAADLGIHCVRLRRLWRTATPIEFAASPFTTRAFEVCSTQSLERPSVIGFFAPRILIPGWLLPGLSEQELLQIVLHESEHLRRRDDWTNLFQKLCLVLFPLNPALWSIERQLSKEREMACDEAVVRITQAPRAYAACLASLAERSLEHRGSRGGTVKQRNQALSLGAWQRRSELVHRVHSILLRNRLMHPVAARALLGAVACSLLVATVELARCPQLVAFVPAAQSARGFTQSAQLGDAVYPADPRHAQRGFFAEQAKAEMPSTPLKQAADRARASLKPAPVEEQRASSEPALSHPNLPAQRPEQLAVRKPVSIGDPANQPQQWIVFTAWEQVETAAAPEEKSPANGRSFAEKTGTTADYDASASPAPSPDSKTATAAATTSGTRVTQLIFKVVPAGSKSSHTAAVPFGGGWIVIQL